VDLPARIGKYELQKFLGGGMSHVYRARDTVIGRTVAVKILTPAGCADQEAKARFLLEAQMSGNIAHDNIINIFDYGEEQGRPYIVMEFLVGQDLRDAIKNNQTGDLDGKLRIALQVARALEYVHSRKIIHRDIKPENIHLDAAGKAKLMDFGIAKAQGLTMTRAGFALGTPYYMAPEQVLGETVTDSVDIYAFGILFYELMTGDKPVKGESVERLFYAILNEPLNPEGLRQMSVPQPIIDFVLRCTAKKAVDRYPTFTAVVGELEKFLRKPDPVPVVAEASRKSGKMVAIIIASVVLLGVAGAVWWAWPKPKPVLPATITSTTGPMMLVPAGRFLYGQDKKATIVPDFYIDRSEVSNFHYEKFCRETGHALPLDFPTDRPGLAILASDILIHAALPRSAWRDSTMANGRRLPLIRIERKANGRLVPSIHGPYEGARGQLEAVAACLFDNLGRGISYKWLLDVIGRKSDDFASRHLLRQYISALREMLLASKSPYFVAVVKERGLCEFAKSPRHSVSVGLDEGASEIGNKVRQLRIAAGLTQTALRSELT